MATSEEIFRDAIALPPDARAELTERLIASLVEDISPEVTTAQLAEVRHRITEVESGEAALIAGDEALARVRNLLANHPPFSWMTTPLPPRRSRSYSSPMASIIEIQKLALNLSEQERATLAANLLDSLPGVLSDEDEGVAEALRRDAEIDADPNQAMSLAQLNSEIQSRRS